MGLFGGITRGLTALGTGGLSEVARAAIPGSSSTMDTLDTAYVAGGALMGTAGLAGLAFPAAGAATAGVGGATSAGSAAGGVGGWVSANPLAAAYLGTGLFGSVQQAKAMREANATNRSIAQNEMSFSDAQARRQMDYQTMMSNTAYQRQSADMRAAGINPIVGFGSGASTPGGAAGSAAGATMEPVPSVAASMLTSAKDGLELVQGLRESDSRIASNRASAGLAAMSTDEKSANAFKARLQERILRALAATGKNVYDRLQLKLPDGFEYNH